MHSRQLGRDVVTSIGFTTGLCRILGDVIYERRCCLLKKTYSTSLGSTAMPNQFLLLAPTEMLLLLSFDEHLSTHHPTKCSLQKLTEIIPCNR